MPPITKGTTPDGREAWLVRSHDQVTKLLVDNRIRIQPPSSKNPAWFADSPMHRVLLRLADRAVPDGQSDREERQRRRVTLTKMFKRSNVHRSLPDVKGFADALIDQMLADGAPVDLTDRFSVPLCAKVVCDLLGVPDADIPLFRKWAGDKDSQDFRTAAIALRQLTNYVNRLMAQRRENPGDDIVSYLLATDAEDELHESRTANLIVFLLGLGWRAPAAALDYGIILLLTHPDQRELLERDPALMPGAVEEVLRRINPTPPAIGGADRYAEMDFEFEGADIRKDDMIVLDIHAANHDPDVFERPLDFDIRRDPNPHHSFGGGAFYCNFNQVARTELAVGFEALLRRFPTMRLAKPLEEIEFLSFPSTGPVQLPVAW